jgi:pepsin A
MTKLAISTLSSNTLLIFIENFWFANFTVGAKDDLVMLIDTGSTDVYLNPGVYVPSKSSTNLHDNFTITFATTNPDGSGTETVYNLISHCF